MYILALLFNVLLVIQLLVFSCILFHVAWRERQGHPYGWGSSLATALLLVFCSVMIFHVQLIPYPYIGFMSWWSVAWLLVSMAYIARVKWKERLRDAGNVSLAHQDGIDKNKDGLEAKHERARKAFHLAGFLVLVAYHVVGPFLAPLVHGAILEAGEGYTALWGPLDQIVLFETMEEAGRYLTLFALVATLILVTLLDAARLLIGEEYSLIHQIEKRAGRILREKEKGSPGPQVYIAASATAAWIVGMTFLPTVPSAMQLALAAIMVATLADGIAAIVGKAWGRHKIERPFDQVKSVEGLIAGGVAALVISLFFTGWMLAIIVALCFVALDYLSPPVADNVLNPVILCVLLCSIATFL